MTPAETRLRSTAMPWHASPETAADKQLSESLVRGRLLRTARSPHRPYGPAVRKALAGCLVLAPTLDATMYDSNDP